MSVIDSNNKFGVPATGSDKNCSPWRRDLFATILANIDDGVSVQDRDRHIVYANESLKRSFGDDIEGRYCFEIYHQRAEACTDCPADVVLKTGTTYHTKRRIQNSKRGTIFGEFTAAPLFDEQGQIVAVVEVVHNITDQELGKQDLLEEGERLRRLAAVGKEIASGLDLGGILEKVVQYATELTSADAGTVALLDEKNNEIRYPYHFNMPAKLADAAVPKGNGIAGLTMKTGQPVLLDDYPSHPDQVPIFTEAGVKTIMAVPLMIGDRPVGALGLFGKSPGKKFTQTDLEMAQAVAGQAAVAIENANLFNEIGNQLRVQRELNQVAVSITSGLELGHVLQEVTHHASEVVNADSAMIALLDEEEGVITYPYAHNLPQHLRQVTGQLGKGVAGRVIETREPRIDNDYSASELRNPAFVEAGIKSIVTVPLMIADRCIGAIGVMDKGSGQKFFEDDIGILSIISRQAAVAVENARLYGKLSQSAQLLEGRVKERTEALSRMYQESERKSRELEEANIKLREVDRMKSEFLANMSHELRTPLNSIIGFSKLVLDGLDGEVNEEQQKDLGIIHANGLELLRLIDDLLSLAKIEAGRIDVVLVETPPDILVEEAVISMRANAGEKGLELKHSFPEDLHPVNMDAGKIRQVIVNLIGNAIKFTEAGTIIVAIEQTSDETVFSVADTGIGISPTHFAEIFDRFHQEKPGEAASAGVGLGLAISKRLVEMHRGRIWVESEPGKGSTFSFSVPNSNDVAN